MAAPSRGAGAETSGSGETRAVAGVLGVLLVAALCFSVAQTTVLAALPEIARRFDTSAVTASWTVTAYLLSASVATPLAGKLGDVVGKGRVLGWVLVVFSVGSIVCALAPSIGWLIGGRVLQGVAGGVFPLAFGIVHDELPADRRALGVGLVSGMFGAGAAVGLPLAGVVIEHGELSWIFWGMLVASLPGALAAWSVVPPSPVRARRRIDGRGALTLSAGLVVTLLGISQANRWGWESPATVLCLVGGVAILVAFVALQARTADALVDVRVLRRRAVLATNVAGLCSGMAMFSAFVLVPQFAHAPTSSGYGLGLSLTDAGLVTVPMVAMMLVAAPLASAIGARIGFRLVLAAGLATGSAAFLLLAVSHGSVFAVVAGVTVLGIGIALAFAGMSVLVIAAVPSRDIGIATGINTIMRTIGAAFGTAIVTAILTADRIPGTVLPTEDAYIAAFLFSAAVALVGIGVALSVPRGSMDEYPLVPTSTVGERAVGISRAGPVRRRLLYVPPQIMRTSRGGRLT
jgi:EmrB/QacA subfamily drug resistance transporter